jgi:hypothetical protein
VLLTNKKNIIMAASASETQKVGGRERSGICDGSWRREANGDEDTLMEGDK